MTQSMTGRNKDANNVGSSVSETPSLHLAEMQQDVSQSPQKAVQLPVGLEGQFMVKPTFLQVVRKIKGVDPSKAVFTYKEVSTILQPFDIRELRTLF